MRKKEEIECWDVKDLLQHAIQFYPFAKQNANDEDWCNNARTQIIRTLRQHQFTLIDGKKYQVSSEIGKYIIEVLLYGYFMNDNSKKKEAYIQKATERREKLLQDMETMSLKEDEKASMINGVDFIIGCMNGMIEQDPTSEVSEKMQERIDNYTEKSNRYYELTNGTKIEKSALEYHIPKLLNKELNDEVVDKIIDRMMIRAVFELFYDFNEREFRAALYERAAHLKELSSGEIDVKSGYSELSRRLENPLGNFITLKKKQ